MVKMNNLHYICKTSSWVYWLTKIILEMDRDINEAYQEDNWVEIGREEDTARRQTDRQGSERG